MTVKNESFRWELARNRLVKPTGRWSLRHYAHTVMFLTRVTLSIGPMLSHRCDNVGINASCASESPLIEVLLYVELSFSIRFSSTTFPARYTFTFNVSPTAVFVYKC